MDCDDRDESDDKRVLDESLTIVVAHQAQSDVEQLIDLSVGIVEESTPSVGSAGVRTGRLLPFAPEVTGAKGN